MLPFPVRREAGCCSSVFAGPEHLKCGFPERPRKWRVLCRSARHRGGRLGSPPPCNPSQRQGRCFQTGPGYASGAGMMWLLLGSSDGQGGIKLFNSPDGFWLGLMAIKPTVPVTSTARGVNAGLIIEGCICMLHPVIINPASSQQPYFVVHPGSSQQPYFIVHPHSLQQPYFQQC